MSESVKNHRPLDHLGIEKAKGIVVDARAGVKKEGWTVRERTLCGGALIDE